MCVCVCVCVRACVCSPVHVIQRAAQLEHVVLDFTLR